MNQEEVRTNGATDGWTWPARQRRRPMSRMAFPDVRAAPLLSLASPLGLYLDHGWRGWSLLAMVGNLLHPATPTGDPEGVARTIGESGSWVPVHLMIVVGLILMLGGLVAICHSIRGGAAGALARLRHSAAVAGVAVGLILVIIDGGAAKHLADAWQEAPAEEAAAALRVVVGEETINFALAALFNILFAGVTFILLGLAVVMEGQHPRGPAWAVVVAGLGSILVGLVQAHQGESVTFTRAATIIFPTIITLWVAWMSVRMLQTTTAARSTR